MRSRRNHHWCRTEDVRTITEGDANTDRWKIEIPPGIGDAGGRSQKEIIQGGEMSKQLAGERDGENNENRLEARIVKLEEQTKCEHHTLLVHFSCVNHMRTMAQDACLSAHSITCSCVIWCVSLIDLAYSIVSRSSTHVMQKLFNRVMSPTL